jgi:hypothetical protein
MGETYRILHKGKMIRRGKYHWANYKSRKGQFELQVWVEKGKGWQTVGRSTTKSE